MIEPIINLYWIGISYQQHYTTFGKPHRLAHRRKPNTDIAFFFCDSLTCPASTMPASVAIPYPNAWSTCRVFNALPCSSVSRSQRSVATFTFQSEPPKRAVIGWSKTMGRQPGGRLRWPYEHSSDNGSDPGPKFYLIFYENLDRVKILLFFCVQAWPMVGSTYELDICIG